jgi:hypothetical protein
MAFTHTGQITTNLSISTVETDSGRTATATFNEPTESLTDGTDESEFNVVYSAVLTIADSSTPQDLDLRDSTLRDINGAGIALVEAVQLKVRADDGNTVNVLMGAAAADPWNFGIGTTATMTLRPNQWFDTGLVENPAIPVAGSNDRLRFAIASGTNQVVRVFIMGRNA